MGVDIFEAQVMLIADAKSILLRLDIAGVTVNMK